MSELTSKLRFLVSLNEPENGGPFGGTAAQECVTAMRDAAACIEALEQALRPFAEAAMELDECEPGLEAPDDMSIERALWEESQPTVGHLRAARAALAQTGEPTG